MRRLEPVVQRSEIVVGKEGVGHRGLGSGCDEYRSRSQLTDPPLS